MAALTDFVDTHFRHFNAGTLVEAARGWRAHTNAGHQMMVTLAGAMSTAELGRSLAPLIRAGQVHAICCTGANLEEDLFNLVAHNHYERIPEWRTLSPEQERALADRGMNRVTDTCIPEDQAFRAVEQPLLQAWLDADRQGQRRFPHQYLYQLLQEGRLADRYQVDPAQSWLYEAAQRELPLFVPGWEDSTLGNILVSHVLSGELTSTHIVKSGLEYMAELAEWYLRTTMETGLQEAAEGGAVKPDQARRLVGFFQIGGGIAGDFPICVVPMLHQDLGRACPYWGYFCQISDSTTSYGSYSGAVPTEKITWGKLDIDTPRFLIESDATIVAPLLFAYVLGW